MYIYSNTVSGIKDLMPELYERDILLSDKHNIVLFTKNVPLVFVIKKQKNGTILSCSFLGKISLLFTPKTCRIDFGLPRIKPLTLALSWIIRGVDGVTSDRHLAGSRPTKNPLSLKGRGNNVSPVHFSKGRRVGFSLPSKNNTNADEVVIHLPLLGEVAESRRGIDSSTNHSLTLTLSQGEGNKHLINLLTYSLIHFQKESRCA